MDDEPLDQKRARCRRIEQQASEHPIRYGLKTGHADDAWPKDAVSRPAGRLSSEKPVTLLRIERQANGGWLVEGRDEVNRSEPYMTRPQVSGAFTSTGDMLRALADLLEQDDKKREEKDDG